MKRTIYSHSWLIVLLMAMMVLLLSACERQIQRNDVVDAPTPVPVIPQPQIDVPTPQPIIPDAPVDEAAPIDTDPDVVQPPPAEDQPPPPDPVVTDPPPAAVGGPVTYIVQAGDTLGRIAQRYNVTIDDIAAANNLTNIHRLEVGQTLIIPVGGVTAPPTTTGETVHIVQAGENLYRIGLRYGFTADELAQYNGITNVHRIYVGQEIRIPPRN